MVQTQKEQAMNYSLVWGVLDWGHMPQGRIEL